MSDETPTAPAPEPPPAAPGVPPAPPAAPPPPAGDASGGGSGSENRSVMLVLSYLWVFAIIPFLFEKDDGEVKWHAKHGLVLTGAEIILWIVVSVLNSILGAVLPLLGCLGGCGLYLVLWVGTLVFRIMAMSKALKGERMTVPGLSEFADKF